MEYNILVPLSSPWWLGDVMFAGDSHLIVALAAQRNTIYMPVLAHLDKLAGDFTSKCSSGDCSIYLYHPAHPMDSVNPARHYTLKSCLPCTTQMHGDQGTERKYPRTTNPSTRGHAHHTSLLRPHINTQRTTHA